MQPEIAHLHKRHPYQGAIWIAVIALIALCVCAQGVQGAGTATQRSPTATMTAKPTLTPRPTLTAEQVKEQPIQAVTMSHHAKFILYNGSLTVVDDIGPILTGKGGVELAKQDVFNIEQAIWAHWPDPLVIANVQVMAQGFENGHAKDALIAWADLLHDTERTLNWMALTAESAWNMYDLYWTANT